MEVLAESRKGLVVVYSLGKSGCSGNTSETDSGPPTLESGESHAPRSDHGSNDFEKAAHVIERRDVESQKKKTTVTVC